MDLPGRPDRIFQPNDTSNNLAAGAWTAFWAEQEADSRCLANAHPDVRKSLDSHWVKFAASLAPSSRILDIGCGAGIVGRILLEARSDLRVTGVDLASVAPSSDRRLCLMAETAMEYLPFENQHFDAAVSQFGFEYGSVTRAGREATRVLVPGAPFSFIVHHAHSQIVREDQDRKIALRAVLDSRVEHAFLSGHVANLDRLLDLARRGAPSDVIVDMVANALRSRLALSRDDRRAMWTAILEALAPERELIAALENACVAPDHIDHWLAKLSAPLQVLNATVLRRPNGLIIAWMIEGVKSPIN